MSSLTEIEVGLARVEERLASIEEYIVDKQKTLEGKVDKLENAKWRQWIAIVLLSVGGSKLVHWFEGFLGKT